MRTSAGEIRYRLKALTWGLSNCPKLRAIVDIHTDPGERSGVYQHYELVVGKRGEFRDLKGMSRQDLVQLLLSYLDELNDKTEGVAV